MPREIPICERELNKEYVLEVIEFLEGFSLTDRQAMVVYEVGKVRKPHVGADYIAKKLKTSGFSESEVEGIFKELSLDNKGFLKIYPPKKEVLIAQLASYGADVVKIIDRNCYSTILPDLDKYKEEFSSQSERPFFNPMGWHLPFTTKIWNEHEETIGAEITALAASDQISHESLGTTIYGTIAAMEIQCLKCGRKNGVDVSFDISSFWTFTFDFECPECYSKYEIQKDLNFVKKK